MKTPEKIRESWVKDGVMIVEEDGHTAFTTTFKKYRTPVRLYLLGQLAWNGLDAFKKCCEDSGYTAEFILRSEFIDPETLEFLKDD